jgi:hypothetical protein
MGTEKEHWGNAGDRERECVESMGRSVGDRERECVGVGVCGEREGSRFNKVQTRLTALVQIRFKKVQMRFKRA